MVFRYLLINIYYGERDCDGPGEYGNIAVYRYDLNKNKSDFQFYLDHLAGWAC